MMPQTNILKKYKQYALNNFTLTDTEQRVYVPGGPKMPNWNKCNFWTTGRDFLPKFQDL